MTEFIFEKSEKFIDEYKKLLPDLVDLCHNYPKDDRGEINLQNQIRNLIVFSHNDT